MLENANSSMNGTQQPSCYNPAAEKIGKTFAYCLIFLVSLAGNTFIVIIVYKTKPMRKSINFLIVNMAMSDLLYPIFVIPRIVTELYVDSWLIGGVVGQALCKLVHFFHWRHLCCCIYWEPGSDSIRSTWSCGISSPFPFHHFKAVPVLHSRHLDRRDGHPLSRCRGLQTCWISKGTGLCTQVAWSLWRVLSHRKLLFGTDSYNVLHSFDVDSHTLRCHLF